MIDARSKQLTFLVGKRLQERQRGLAYRVMLFEPKGIYPSGTRFVPNGFFHADEQIAFSVVLGESWDGLDPEAPFSEFDWASPQELRLMASLLLCERRDGVYVRFYPIVRFGPLLDADQLDLEAPETITGVRAILLERAANSKSRKREDRISRRLSRAYDLVEPERYGFDRLLAFWSALALPNYVLLRGVYALVKADMLSCHYEFCEEAIVSLYIALEASFSLVSRRLKSDGCSNPTAHDAAVWLHRHFDAPFGLPAPAITEKYFQEFYEQRIMTLHPASRYGDLPYAPIMHDDIPHLRRSLREIFAYLVLGTHGSDYLEDVRRDGHVGEGAC